MGGCWLGPCATCGRDSLEMQREHARCLDELNPLERRLPALARGQLQRWKLAAALGACGLVVCRRDIRREGLRTSRSPASSPADASRGAAPTAAASTAPCPGTGC